MTYQPGQQTIAIHIQPNITQGKGNQAIKFGQVIKNNIFFRNHAENEPGKLVPDLILFF